MDAHTLHAARVSTGDSIPAQVVYKNNVSQVHLVSSDDAVLARLAAEVLDVQSGHSGGVNASVSAHGAVADGHVSLRCLSINGSFKPSGGFDEQKPIEVQHNIGSV